MTGVPPGARCTQRGCDRPAIDPDHPAGLCERHLSSNERTDRTAEVQRDSWDENASSEADETDRERAATEGASGGSSTYRQLYLDAHDRANASGAYVPHDEIVAAFEDAGWGDLVDHLPSISSWLVWTPDSNDDPIYAYTPDLAGDTSAARERLADLLKAADVDTGAERFIDVHDGQKGRFDTAGRPPDDPNLSGNYGVLGGRGGNPDGAWLVDIDIDDYDDAKESNPRVEQLRGETLSVASAHTTVERPGHLYVLVDGDPRAVVRDVVGRNVDNLSASFGDIRVKNQYVVGPGSEIVCGCDRCTAKDAPDHFGCYELATERPPVVLDEDEFAAFLKADSAVRKRAKTAEKAWNVSADGEPKELTDDADVRLNLAKTADDYVANALREAANPDDRSMADASLARAIAPWVNYDERAIQDVLDRRGTSKWDARTDDSYRGSILDYAIDRERKVSAYDPVPYWAVVEFALDWGILDEDDLVRRDSETGDVLEDGGTDGYRAFPDADTYREALAAIEDLGVDHGREMDSGRLDAESDPEELKALDVTLNPEIAWRAAGTVMPDELDGGLQVPTTADDSGWLCPRCGGEIDVVRAAALDTGIAAGCCPDLNDAAYHDAYQYTRRTLDAPLPEYVNHRMTTERWDVVKETLRQLDFWYLDEGALNSEVTGRGSAVAGDADLTLDPAWRDSESGESTLVFPSGTVYEAHPDHDAPLDVLRFVALDSGAISWDEFTDDEYHLTGETFRHVYEIARLYGAPLPRWSGTDAYHTVVLPPAEELIDEDVGNDERLKAAYDAVGDLYVDTVESGETSLIRAVPGLGKSSRVVRHADEYPPLYTAGRKELMQEARNRADKHGFSAEILPVFAERGPPGEVKTAAKEIAQESGQHILKNRWNLPSLVEELLEEIGAEADIPDPDDYDPSSEDDVTLDRESCPVADGEYGVEWWLAVHAARELEYRPQRIHERAETLFGRPLPCTCSNDEDVEDGEVTCPYTEGWERATDPDEPVDILIGHYTHANVEGGRTYAVRQNGRVRKVPRVCVADEFASDAFQRDFGSEYPDHAAWLAGTLRADVVDREDVYRKADTLWEDEVIRDWLADNGTSDEHSQIVAVLEAADAALDATETAKWILKNRQDACNDLGVEDALDHLTDLYPEWDAGVVTDVIAEISAAVTAAENRSGHTNVLNRLDELADRLRETQLDAKSLEVALDAALEGTSHVDGALADLVESAIDAYWERDDNARGTLTAARTALEGGADGCETLAMYAEDGYAHPLAHALLFAILAPSDADEVSTVRTSDFTFGLDERTTFKSVSYQNYQILADRKQNGAVVNDPPAFNAANEDNPVVVLDATGRSALWELILGRDVVTRDIHDSMEERREFLREVFGLQIIQTTRHAYSYEGDPSGKNLDDDVELVAEIDRQYGDAVGHNPVVVTTKNVETHLGDRLQDVASETAHYGDLKGSNALADRRLATLLGCQHYSDSFVERWAALAGQEVHRTGRGATLNYNCHIGNELLRHMQEDQVMQAALRFGRDTGGALVFAHTAALRPDLPVVAEGQVVESFSKGVQATAEALATLANRRWVTISDVVDVHSDPPERRTVRRHLNRFVEAGYLDKTETANGLANEFSVDEVPPPAEFDLPNCETRAADDEPGRDALETNYTWSVRVHPDEPRAGERCMASEVRLPAPDEGDDLTTPSAPPG